MPAREGGSRRPTASSILSSSLGDARTAALEALRIAEDLGSGFSLGTAYANLASVYFAAGEFAEAVEYSRKALELARSRRLGLEFEASTLARIARCQARNGEGIDALESARESLVLAQERGQRYWELMAELAHAEALAAAQGSKGRKAAERALQNAARLMGETGARAWEPQIVEARGRLAQACGDAGAREKHLRDAHALYVAIGAAGHAKRIATELDA